MKADKKQYLLAAAIFLLGCVVSAVILFHPFSAVKAKAVGEKVTFTFYAKDGTVWDRVTCTEGDSILPPNYSEDGFFFKGWREDGVDFYPVLEDVQAVANAVYADYTYADSRDDICLVLHLGGQVECSDFTVCVTYDKDLLRYKKATDAPNGVEITDDSQSGILMLHGTGDTVWDTDIVLAQLHFEMRGSGSYETSIPICTKEILTLQGSEKVFTDSTAYESKLYLISDK